MQYREPYAIPYTGPFGSIYGGFFSPGSKLGLDCSFDFFSGVADQAVVNGQEMGQLQGVHTGIIVVTLSTALPMIADSIFEWNKVGDAQEWLISKDEVPFTTGTFCLVRGVNGFTSQGATQGFTNSTGEGPNYGNVVVNVNNINWQDQAALNSTEYSHIPGDRIDSLHIMENDSEGDWWIWNFVKRGTRSWDLLGRSLVPTPSGAFVAHNCFFDNGALSVVDMLAGSSAHHIMEQRGPEVSPDPDLNQPDRWTLPEGWSVAGGKIHIAAGRPNADDATIQGEFRSSGIFEFIMVVDSFSGLGDLTVSIGGAFSFMSIAGPGTVKGFIQAGADDILSVIVNSGSTAAIISSLSVKQVHAPYTLDVEANPDPDFLNPGLWTLAPEWTISGGKLILDGTQGSPVVAEIVPTETLIEGQNYEIEILFDELDQDGGSGGIYVRIGGKTGSKIVTTPGRLVYRNQCGADQLLEIVPSNLLVKCTIDSFSIKKVLDTGEIDELPGDILDGRFGPAETVDNVLTLVNGDELHDDYPDNGVGKIKKGAVLFSDPPLDGGQLGGGHGWNKPGTGDLRKGFFQIVAEAVRAGHSLICSRYAEQPATTVYQTGFQNVMPPNYPDQRVILRANTDGTYRFIIRNDAGTFEENVTITVSPPVRQHVEWQFVLGGYDSLGQPDPLGLFGCAMFDNDLGLMFTGTANDMTVAYAFGVGLADNSPINHLRTKRDQTKLVMPQRALFHAPDLYTGWTILQDNNNRASILGNTITAGEPTGARCDFSTGPKAVVGKTYEVTCQSAVTDGTVEVISGGLTVLTLNNTTDGLNTFQFTAIAEGDVGVEVQFQSAAKGTIYDLTFSLVGPLDFNDYRPENGVQYSVVQGGMNLDSEQVHGETVGGLDLATYYNPGGGYWEASITIGGTGTFPGLLFRYQNPQNFWSVQLSGDNPSQLNLYEVIAGGYTTHINNAPTTQAIPGKFRLILKDDGENIQIILPESGDVFDHVSTAGNGRTLAGIIHENYGSVLNSQFDWHGARMGTVAVSRPYLTKAEAGFHADFPERSWMFFNVSMGFNVSVAGWSVKRDGIPEDIVSMGVRPGGESVRTYYLATPPLAGEVFLLNFDKASSDMSWVSADGVALEDIVDFPVENLLVSAQQTAITNNWTSLADYLIVETWNVITSTPVLIQVQQGMTVHDITLQQVVDCDLGHLPNPLENDVKDWRATLGYPCP